jgi:hypothetical protein
MSNITIEVDLTGSIEVLNLDKELEKLEKMTFEELRGKKTYITNYKKEIEKVRKETSKKMVMDEEQEAIYQKFRKNKMDKDYPVEDVTDKIKEINAAIRLKTFDRFRLICHKNISILISDDYINKINDELLKFKTYNHHEHNNEIIICECGRTTARKNMAKHRNTIIHLRDLKKIEMNKCENNNNTK